MLDRPGCWIVALCHHRTVNEPDALLDPDPILGFYGPRTAMWRINREAVLLAAGPAALLLQVAHPLVAEGVAQHSRFEADPFARLRRTLHTTMDLVFGDGETAQTAVRRLNGVHARVRGDVSDGVARTATGATTYRALDPALLLWVQVTLVVTSVRATERWVRRVGDAEADTLWREARALGVRMGIPLERSPADWPALMAYWDAMLAPDGPLQVTPTALRLAPTIIRPRLPLAPGWLVGVTALPGLALLPERIRRGYGIRWSPAHERGAALLGRSLHLWVRVMPPDWRAMPQARAADRRVRAADRRVRDSGPVASQLRGTRAAAKRRD